MIYVSFILFISFFILLPLFNGIIGTLINITNPKYYVLIGITIKKKNIHYNHNFSNPKNDFKIKKRVGNYIFTNNNDIFVYPKLIWSGFYNIRTGYSLRLFGKIENNEIKMRIKISAFSLIHTIIAFIGLILLIIWSLMTNQDIIVPIAGFLFLVILIIGNVQTYFAIEDNYNSMIKELKEIITTHYTG